MSMFDQAVFDPAVYSEAVFATAEALLPALFSGDTRC